MFRFNGTTLTQQKVLTGVGTPGTGAVRSLENLGSGVIHHDRHGVPDQRDGGVALQRLLHDHLPGRHRLQLRGGLS